MKKLLLACASLLVAVAAYGQGQVTFANTTSTLFSTNGTAVGQGSGLMAGGAGQWRVGLYTAADGTTDESLFTLTALATNIPVGGRFQHNPTIFTFSANNGIPIAFQVKAWSLAGGASYEAALAASLGGAPGGTSYYYGGKSPLGRVTPAVGGAPVPGLFGTGSFAGQLTSGVTLVPLVPEPSSIALGLLGLGAIALFRRRK